MSDLDSITMVTLPMSELERVAGRGYVEYLRTMCVYPKQPDPERARLVAEIKDAENWFAMDREPDIEHLMYLLRRCREALG